MTLICVIFFILSKFEQNQNPGLCSNVEGNLDSYSIFCRLWRKCYRRPILNKVTIKDYLCESEKKWLNCQIDNCLWNKVESQSLLNESLVWYFISHIILFFKKIIFNTINYYIIDITLSKQSLCRRDDDDCFIHTIDLNLRRQPEDEIAPRFQMVVVSVFARERWK